MDKIIYNISLVKQGVSECLPASATEMLNYFGIHKTFEEVKREVPLYISPEGAPIGTSIGHMGTYLIEQGFSVTLHVMEIEIFDQSWVNLSSEEMIGKLDDRRKHLRHGRYGDEALDVIVDGYKQFLSKGGKIVFPVLSEEYLYNCLKQQPFLAVTSYNFLNKVAKYRFNKENEKHVQDAIEGNPTTHAVVVAGYDNGKFLIVDPDFEYGGERWIDADRLIGAIYLAETDFDSVILTLSKN